MKKLLLSLLMGGAAMFSYAQTRTIDWSTTEIVSPDSLRTTSGGTPIPLEFVMKNMSGDSAHAGDSIWWQMAITDPGMSTAYLLYPGPSTNNYSIKVLNEDVAPGDTIHLAISLNANGIGVDISGDIQLIIASHIVNRPNLGFEGAATIGNNTKNKPMVWYNEDGWGVGIPTVDLNTSTHVYPNPAKDVLNIDFDKTSSGELVIMDMAGKQLETIQLSRENKIDVSNYAAGVYFYQVKSEGAVTTGKFTVSK